MTHTLTIDPSARPAPVLQRLLRTGLGRMAPPTPICRHREWTKFGVYTEETFCRLVDDLC